MAHVYMLSTRAEPAVPRYIGITSKTLKHRFNGHLSAACAGKKRAPFTEEHIRNLSEAGKGKTPWNKGMKFNER
jgi:GIY-YIG catalytic domain/NUMOD3 motif